MKRSLRDALDGSVVALGQGVNGIKSVVLRSRRVGKDVYAFSVPTYAARRLVGNI